MRKSPPKTPAIERFEAKYIPEPNSGCWLWMGAHTRKTGYGCFYEEGAQVGSHVFSYRHFVGPIPDGFDIDHLCRNRCCVNPNHLEAVPRQVNAARGLCGHHMKGKTRCSKGHALDDENTYLRANGNRSCRICERFKMQRLRAKWRSEGHHANVS